MKARLGIYEKEPYQKPGVADDQAIRLEQMGGYRQQDRMIRAKRQSLDRALFYSYQAAEISPVDQPQERHRALMNPNQLKPDYDDKILSVGYENNYKPGDVFIWHRRQANMTIDSHWLIYLQDLTELAYFKGDVRKCNYYVRWLDENNQEHGRWIALRGPVETNINSIAKEGVSIDVPNHTLHILISKDEDTIKYFSRYAKFYVTGVDSVTDKICWRIEATDTMSMPGVIELTAHEYYANESEDKDGIVGALVAVPSRPEEDVSLIEGVDFIRPKKAYVYSYKGTQEGQWTVKSKTPIDYTINGLEITLSWPKTYGGEILLSFGDTTKKITVESLF